MDDDDGSINKDCNKPRSHRGQALLMVDWDNKHKDDSFIRNNYAATITLSSSTYPLVCFQIVITLPVWYRVWSTGNFVFIGSKLLSIRRRVWGSFWIMQVHCWSWSWSWRWRVQKEPCGCGGDWWVGFWWASFYGIGSTKLKE